MKLDEHASGRTTRLAVMVCIFLLTLTVLLPRAAAAPLSAPEGRPAGAIRLRIEGYLKSMGPGKWLVDQTTILVDSGTIVVEKRGRAEPGAWVVVWGLYAESGSIYGELIEVDRPASGSGPIRQFTGVVTKHIVRNWVISTILVEQTDTTQIRGTPDVGWLVWVVAEQQGTSLRALVIEAIADTPESVPVEFTGVLEALGPSGGRVDGRSFVLAEKAVKIGEPVVGQRVDVRATQDRAGSLVVHLLRAVGTPVSWSQLQGIGVEQGFVQTVDSLPDPSAPVALADAPEMGVTTSLWSAPAVVADGLASAAGPSLAYTNDGIAHALWESNGNLLYAFQAPGQGWSRPQRIASGREPALAVDRTGRLHALFAHQFLDNFEIFHITRTAGVWSLPVNVARTSGVSMQPALAADNQGKLQAAWMDNTQGYWTIYAATWSGNFWSNQPVPHGRGESPAMAVSCNGTIYLAWQDRVPTRDDPTGKFAIFLSERRSDSGSRWSLPLNISDRDEVNATEVSIAATTDGLAQLAWIENDRTVRYDFGQGLYWPLPRTVAQASIQARGPRIVAAAGDYLHIAWDEKNVLRATSALQGPLSWPNPEVVITLQGTLKDVGFAVTPNSEITLSWVQIPQAGGTAIYQSRYVKLARYRTWLPMGRAH